MLITKYIEIDTGHRVPFHNGKCRGFHGHRYRVEVGVDDKVIQEQGSSDEGMVIDFSDLKKIMMGYIDDHLDHTSIYYDNDPCLNSLAALEQDSPKPIVFVSFIPTAENLAKYIYERIKKPLEYRKIKIAHVLINETPSSSALYKE